MEPANKQNYTIELKENKGKICFKVCLFVQLLRVISAYFIVKYIH